MATPFSFFAAKRSTPPLGMSFWAGLSAPAACPLNDEWGNPKSAGKV